MKVVCLIQARVGSTRLPGKILKNVCGKTILNHDIDRLKKCKFDITKIWAEIPKNNFKKYGNDSEKIKIKSKK